jgi:hypothetical protein
MLKRLKEFSELQNIICPYLTTQWVSLKTIKLIQVNMTTFIRIIQEPDFVQDQSETDCDNLLIIQGGIRHMSKQSYYLKHSSSYYEPHLRVFVFEQFNPLIDFSSTEDLKDVFRYIRAHYRGNLVAIGFSMGGLLLSTYLAKTQEIEEDPSLFITCCNSFDFTHFKEVLNNNALFSWIQRRDLAAFGVESYEELKIKYEMSEEQEAYMTSLHDHMNQNRERWRDRLLWVLGEKDPLTINYKKQLKRFEKPPYTVCCRNGWHCCSYCISTAVEFATEFLYNLNSDPEYQLKEMIK